MKSPLVAFILGVLSFPVLFLVGEGLGLAAAYTVLAAYFFTCQFFLSRGGAASWRVDWRIVLSLDAVPLALFVVTALAEKREVVLSQGVAMLAACCGGTLAGLIAASLTARRAALPPEAHHPGA
jgi:uncharacterized membrane protein YeiH